MNALRRYFKESGKTILQVSRETGIPRPTIYTHLDGSREMSIDAAKRYHRLLGIPLSDLRPDVWGAEVLKEACK